jgi:hypothetical protein
MIKRANTWRRQRRPGHPEISEFFARRVSGG